MGFWDKITDFFGYEWVRARDGKGRFVADDKSTPDVDESKKKVYKKKTVEVNYPMGVDKTQDVPIKTKNYRKVKPRAKPKAKVKTSIKRKPKKS